MDAPKYIRSCSSVQYQKTAVKAIIEELKIEMASQEFDATAVQEDGFLNNILDALLRNFSRERRKDKHKPL